jgi:hypothetical protein
VAAAAAWAHPDAASFSHARHWPPSHTPVVHVTATSTKRSTKPCYVGTHSQQGHDSKLVKALEAKGTVACEQPPRPNLNPSTFPGILANLG